MPDTHPLPHFTVTENTGALVIEFRAQEGPWLAKIMDAEGNVVAGIHWNIPGGRSSQAFFLNISAGDNHLSKRIQIDGKPVNIVIQP